MGMVQRLMWLVVCSAPLVGCRPTTPPSPASPSPSTPVVRDASIPCHVTWSRPYKVELQTTPELEVSGLERAADRLRFTLRYPAALRTRSRRAVHSTWGDILAQAQPDAALRLHADAALESRPPRMTVAVEPGLGFSVTLSQLLSGRPIWVGAFDILVSSDPHADRPALPTAVASTAEARLEDFTVKWEDMGRPDYYNPYARGGHVIPMGWDGSWVKFGIAPSGQVRQPAPDDLRLSLDLGPPSAFRGQWPEAGWPFIRTVYSRDGIEYTLEQFVYPLDGPSDKRSGNLELVMLSQLTATSSVPRHVSIPLQLSTSQAELQSIRSHGGAALLGSARGARVILQGFTGEVVGTSINDKQGVSGVFQANVPMRIEPQQPARLIVKLASRPVDDALASRIAGLDYAATREAALQYWQEWEARGAQFEVPETAVNNLFRAGLWHALTLPYRRDDLDIDIPYSNFAYWQEGVPWPMLHGLYVDHMLYDLRGYHDVSRQELLSIYQTAQKSDGRVSGHMEWFINTPGLMLASAQHYLLTRDRAAFETLLPSTLKAMDWLEAQIEIRRPATPELQGLVSGPLTDVAPDGFWTINQAMSEAALRTLALALEDIGHPRAGPCRKLAETLRQRIESAVLRNAMESPVSELADGSFTPVVMTRLDQPHRQWDIMYPNDVDVGPLHLLSLGSWPADHPLADGMLRDHEENLFYRGWGVTNEPVYLPQGIAYLLRDEPAAAIRTFYSTMASGFSHHALSPVEHRWGANQFFGPPSTDGAWFQLYRMMLIHEWPADTLFLAQATPRPWLDDGRRIRVERAPSRYGPLSLLIESRTAAGVITAAVTMPSRRPATLRLRLRHPARKPMRSVTVNGQPWQKFDSQREWIEVPHPTEAVYRIEARY